MLLFSLYSPILMLSSYVSLFVLCDLFLNDPVSPPFAPVDGFTSSGGGASGTFGSYTCGFGSSGSGGFGSGIGSGTSGITVGHSISVPSSKYVSNSNFGPVYNK